MQARHMVSGLLSSIVLLMVVLESISSANTINETDNRMIYGCPLRETQGSYYWLSSNIREWLNSDARAVQYTNEPPTRERLGIYAYDEEPGFLYEFTQDEKDAIAITERRIFLHYTETPYRDGGSRVPPTHASVSSLLINHYLPNFHKDWKTYYYKTAYDKVFLLSAHEAYEYVQKRGWSLIKRYIGTNMPIEWIFSNGFNNDNMCDHLYGIAKDGRTFMSRPKDARGIVPALHIKPGYVFRDGRSTEDLEIGDTVQFGRYKGQDITWIVINKTSDGFVLLWSEKALTLKPFDAPGDLYSYEYSNSITWNSYDVSLKDSLQYYNPNGDDVPPTIYVVNTQDMDIRQNTSWELTVAVEDDRSGVDYLVLPDGTVTQAQQVTITVSENKVYYFKAVDNAGNAGYLAVPVGNINPPPTVIVQPSTTEWTNRDVTVDIYASNDVGYERSYLIATGRDTNGPTWPNYSSYVSKRIHISGTAELIDYKLPLDNVRFCAGISYMRRYQVDSSYWYTRKWVCGWSVPLSQIDGNKVSFDFVMTVDSDYFQDFYPWLQLNIPSYLRNNYFVEVTNLKYELLDKEDFKIEKIVLPTGQEVYAQSYRDTLTKTGTYRYTIIDNRGYVTERDVTVRIDKVAPSLTIQGDLSTITPGPVILTVNAFDADSGLKWVQTPDGQLTSKTSFTFNIHENGTYVFTAEDFAGNRTTQTIVVTNINAPPEASFSWTPQEPVAGDTVEFSGYATDPDGHPVTFEWAYLGPSNQDWVVFATIATPALVVDEPGTWWIRLVARDPYGFQDTVLEAIQVDPKVVAVCTPLEDPVWAMPGEMVTVGCADQTSGGQVVAGSVVLGSQNFSLVPTAGQIWSSQIPAPRNPGVYIATLQLDVRDPKGRAVAHAVPIQLVVASPVPTPAEGLDVSGPLPGVPGKVRLVR